MKKVGIISIVSALAVGAVFQAVAGVSGQEILPKVKEMFESKKESGTLPALKNPSIVVKKKDRKMHIYDDGKPVKTYTVALGFAPEGDKETEGDGKTPEGEFYVFTKNPKSRFYLSLGLSYPSITDAKRGLKQKIITQAEHDAIIKAIKEKKMPPQNTALGGEIYIHAGGSASDWTLGCVALEEAEIKEIFDAIPIGTSVKIEP